MNMSIQIGDIERQSWCINGGLWSLRECLIGLNGAKWLSKIKNTREHPLFFVDQLLISNRYCISWQAYRSLFHESAKGRPAKWFKSIQSHVVDQDLGTRTLPVSPFNLYELLPEPSLNRATRPLGVLQTFSMDSKTSHFYLGKVVDWTNRTRAKVRLLRQSTDHESTSAGQTSWTYTDQYALVPISQFKIIPGPIHHHEAYFRVDRTWCQLIKELNSMCEQGSQPPSEIPDHIVSIPVDNNNDFLQDNQEEEFKWINRWIADEHVRQQLISSIKSHKSAAEPEIIAYTDGSLTRSRIRNTMGNDDSDDVHIDMGAACFYPSTNTSIATSLDSWPSSTRTELLAILLAVLGTPANSTLHIYSDSQAAICTVEHIINGQLSARKLLKSPNNLLLIKIMTIIREQHINVRLIKVKAHTGIVNNDVADRLAKQAISEGTHQFSNRFISLDGIFNYFLAYEHLPIEYNTRKFVKLIFSAYNTEEWAQLHAFRDRISARDTFWKASWIVFNNLRGFNCNSMKKQIMWTFTAKLFTRSLPLGITLKKRHKSKYDNFVCPSCSSDEEETWDHFVNCSGYATQWNTAFRDIKAAISKFISKNTNLTEIQRHRVTDIIVGTNVMSTKFAYFKSFAMEAKFPSLVYTQLMATTLLTQSQALSISGKALYETIQAFRTHVWIYRCENTAEWERQHNITATDKKSPSNTVAANPRHGRCNRIRLDHQDDESARSRDSDTTVYVLDDFYPTDSNTDTATSRHVTPITRQERCRIAASRCIHTMRKFVSYKAWSSYAYPVIAMYSKVVRLLEDDT